MGSSKASLKRSYENFEPFSKWEKEETRHILVLHLLEFKKQQLRVQVNNLGVLTITGERPLDETRISRFRKETKIPNNVNSNEIRAKFSCGLLHVIMPLKSPSISREDGKSKLDVSLEHTAGGREKRVASRFAALCKPTVGMRSLFPRLTMDRLMAAKVAVAVAVVSALGAYAGYQLRSSRGGK